MALRPKAFTQQSDSGLDTEETLSIDHARWSGFRDGLGERENGVDEQGFSIELLRLRKEFNPFALPLTDRILRLIDFDRPGATRALRVDQDESSPRLILVSERAPGFRLSELLERGAERGVIPDLGAALYIMRRLLATAAAIHRTTGVPHLAIAPERIQITPRGAVVLVEAALAGAIEAFGGRMPRGVQQAIRLPRLDAATDGPQADIARITIAGMAMIVGRPLDATEDIDPLSPVVQEVVEVAAVRAGDLFAAALTPWLDRAISVDPLLGYTDFADAAADLEEMMPPPDARCSISRAPLRKFLDDLSISRDGHETFEEDRLREIRARQIRRGLVPAVEPAAPEPEPDEIDPAAAIMGMPIAVEDLSTEIFAQPVLIDDQPSAMAEVLEHAVPPPDDVDVFGIEPEAEPAESALELDDTSTQEPAVEEPAAESMLEVVDEESIENPVEIVSLEQETLAPIEDTPAYDETWAEPGSEEAVPGESSLDDLVEEILRRGVEPDLPEPELPALSDTEDLLADLQGVGLEVFENAPAEEPADEPPVEEPPAEEPPVDEPIPEEPPADEPPAYDPPVQDPPPDEPPAEAPPPMWVRAAIERVARTRQERPAPAPPRQANARGPVFEIPDEPEAEKAAETTTLSDIAKELGLTIQVPDAKAEKWARTQEPEPAGQDFEEGWEEEIVSRTPVIEAPPAAPPIPFAPQAPVYTPPPPTFEPPPAVFAPEPPPAIAAAEVFEPLPPRLEPEPPPTFAPAPVAFEAPAPDPAPRRSMAERTAGLRESSGRYFKTAATIVLVVGGLAAAGYGGWRYYSSITTPGTLVVESTPPGAQIEIDGKQHGTTPGTIELPPGSHEVALTRRGITRRFNVAVRPGEQVNQTLDWSQVKETGSLAVTTEPVGARVSVDGKPYGVTPITIPDLPAGRRRVVLEGQGGTVRREVTIETDRTATLSEAIFSGFLAVFAPVELQIFEGTRLVGTTENSRIMIPAGRHELTLVNKDLGTRMTRTVEVEPGQVAAINITEVPATPRPEPEPAPAPAPQD
jgi:hypothetical protein